jgi:CheY-like chemotaxis protein
VEINRDVERSLGRGHSGDVIDVRMRQEDVADGQRFAPGVLEQRLHLVARIDQHRFTRVRTGDDEAVLEEGSDRLRLDYDHTVILAILDDLMFMSKIKTAAGQLGVPVSFVRSSAAALTDMRTTPPALVILDLNNPRTDPLGTVAAMKADPALRTIPTIGFASHVQTDVIEAARQAGVGEVLARSAFSQHIAEIVQRGR